MAHAASGLLADVIAVRAHRHLVDPLPRVGIDRHTVLVPKLAAPDDVPIESGDDRTIRLTCNRQWRAASQSSTGSASCPTTVTSTRSRTPQRCAVPGASGQHERMVSRREDKQAGDFRCGLDCVREQLGRGRRRRRGDPHRTPMELEQDRQPGQRQWTQVLPIPIGLVAHADRRESPPRSAPVVRPRRGRRGHHIRTSVPS
jgi:hypothetical protein